jgi:hypothetical protein
MKRVFTSSSDVMHVYAQRSQYEGRLLYKMIKQGKDIKGHKIGYYTVISVNGVLTIGCHKIKNFKEIGEQLI